MTSSSNRTTVRRRMIYSVCVVIVACFWLQNKARRARIEYKHCTLRELLGMKKMTAAKLPFAAFDYRTDTEFREVVSYKDRLDRDLEWAMDEGDRFFQGTSEAHKSLRRIANRLAELGIDYM